MPDLSKLSGIVPPLVTPLRDGELDHDGLRRLLNHVISHGVHGLFILGTTGEGPSLGYQTRRAMIDTVCEEVAGRLPVLVGVTDTALSESIDMARASQAAGASAVVLAPPCYYPVSQTALKNASRKLANEAQLPVVLYNMPGLTKTTYEIDTVAELTAEPNIIGFKDSSGNLDYFRQILQVTAARKDWFVMTGPEELLSESLAMGGDGGVCGGANVAPDLFVRLYEACNAQDTESINNLNQLVARLGELYKISSDAGVQVTQGLKAALSQLQLCGPELAAPFCSLGDGSIAQVSAVLQDFVTGSSPASVCTS